MLLRVLLGIAWLSCWGLGGLVIWQEWPDELLHVVVCDVGQGDAILISHGFTQLLIDAGADNQVLACLRHYLPFWDRNLEIVIATHADHDHIGGMPAVLDQYLVGSLLLTAQGKESADFKLFSSSVQKLAEKGTMILAPRLGNQIRLGKRAQIEILWPEVGFDPLESLGSRVTETQLSAYFDQKSTSDLSTNDGSIALLLRFNEFSFLTTGDLEEHPESTLVEWGVIKDIDVLKAGHHGSKTSSTAPFLTNARPEFTLVSSGKNNRYGHPHAEVLRRLEEVGSQILRTDELGHIELQSNGQDYWFFHSLTRSN